MTGAALPLTALALLAIGSRRRAQTSSSPKPSADSDAVRAAREASRQDAPPPFVGPPRPIGPQRPPASVPGVATRPGREQSTSAATPASRTRPQPPAGYDRIKAANAAPDIARHIAQKQHNYARKALKAWQIVAGVVPDGIYGPATREALVYYVGSQAPKALYKGSATPYPWGA